MGRPTQLSHGNSTNAVAPVGCLGAASNNIDLLERNRRLLNSAAGSAFDSSTLPPLWFGLQAAIHLTVECSSCEI